MAAATAEVTSMPGVVAPAADARILLTSYDVLDVVEESSELIEEVELISDSPERCYQDLTVDVERNRR
jgi:hypothetical protein